MVGSICITARFSGEGRVKGPVVAGCGVVVELSFLDGRKRLDVPVRSLVTF